MNQISKKFKTECEIKDLIKKRANECYKKNNNGRDCLVEKGSTIRLHLHCDYCEKILKFTPKFTNKKKRSEIILKEPLKKEISLSKELEIPNQTIKKFKYPYLLASYPFFKDSSKFYKLLVKHTIDEEESLENIAYGMYGEYKIISYRNPKLMDIKVLLVNIYLSDYFKSRRYEVSIKEFLEYLKLKSTGYYRNEILKSQHYLKNTTFITPIIDYKTGKKYGIHEWSILAEFKFHDEEKRKYFFEILLGDSFYKNIQKDYTLIELKKVLRLSQIALNLFLFLTTQSPSKLYKYPKDFKDLKIAIGITTKNITWAMKTFEKAWKDIKSKGLLKGYRKSEVFVSKNDNRKKIRFSKQKDLTP